MSFRISQTLKNGNSTRNPVVGPGSMVPIAKRIDELDSSGNPTGNKITVLQVTMPNSSALNGNHNYPDRRVLAPGDTLTIPANTLHSFAFKVLSGTGTIKLGGDAVQNIGAGEGDGWTATNLLNRIIVITCGAASSIVVTTIGQLPGGLP
ncbi:MAG: hypothetical protein EKK37_17315 [Sphingobacteriales bacterium]|nr:MAG: hypothetical protein EKK37_17315 [Sphingobacteriales bacterium]